MAHRISRGGSGDDCETRTVGVSLPVMATGPAPPPLHAPFLADLLAHKKQEASLLFMGNDANGEGVLPARQLRSILLSVFPPPCVAESDRGTVTSLLFDRPSVVALYEELVGLQHLRKVFDKVTGRPFRLHATPLMAPSVFTLSELHSVMEELFLTESKQGRRFLITASLPVRSGSLPQRTPSVPSPSQAIIAGHGAPVLSTPNDADNAVLPAIEASSTETSVPVLPIPREAKPFDAEYGDDSPLSTGRGSSIGGHSSTISYATTGAATNNPGSSSGGAVLLGGGTLRLVSGTAGGSGSGAWGDAVLVPSSQMALSYGSLEAAFHQACEAGRGFTPSDSGVFALTGHTLTPVERASLSSVCGFLSPLGDVMSGAPPFDTFLQLLLAGH